MYLGNFKDHLVNTVLDCEQSLRMVTRARKARARKSSEGSESRGDAGEKAGKEGGTAFSFEPDVFR